MAQVASPQGKEEKNNVPWRIAFTRKDLLAAAWGSKKGADLLYHFLHRASWEAKNKRENETLKDIKFQETTPKALEKSGLSLGCFHTYLKHFVSVGYVSHEAYSDEYVIHLDAIKQAFSKVPEKPVSATEKPRQPRSKSFNLKDYNIETLPMAIDEICFNLKEMFQKLGEIETFLKEMFQSLKQNATIDGASDKALEAISDTLDMLLEKEDALRDSFLGAPSEASYSQEMEQPTEEKKEEPMVSHMAEWLADLDTRMDALDQEYLKDCSHRSWLQETSMQPETASQAPSQENKRLPDGPLSTKPDIPNVALTPKQQEALRKQRMVDIMALADKEFGTRVPRSPKKFVQEALEDLIEGDYTDEQIIFSIKDLKARNRDRTFTEIAKNMATAVDKLKNGLPPGIIPFNKPAQAPQQQAVRENRVKNMTHLGMDKPIDDPIYAMW